MLKVLGVSDQPCFFTAQSGRGVWQVKFDDKSFQGSLHISEIQKQLERRLNSENGSSDSNGAGSERSPDLPNGKSGKAAGS